MRLYGSIHTKFWANPDIQKISDQAKLLAAYLLSSSHTNMLGCFRVPMGYIAEDLKWDFFAVTKAFAELTAINYLTYDAENSWVFIHQFLKYNPIENPNQGRHITKLFNETPKNLSFILQLIEALLNHSEFLQEEFINSLETLSQPLLNQDQNQDQCQKQNQELIMSGKPDDTHPKDSSFEKVKNKSIKALKSQAREVLDFLNEKTGRNYRPVDANLNLITARLSSGATVGQCFQVIAKKFRDWKDNPEMLMYLRPETLFNKKKFESYLGEVSIAKTNELVQ